MHAGGLQRGTAGARAARGAAPGLHLPRLRAPQAAPIEEHEAEEIVTRLAPGCWVDLYARQHWRRARLHWASEKRTLFMFVSHGGQPHSMTLRILQRLIRDRLLRPVNAEAVVPRALAQLAQQPQQAAAVAA